MKARSDSLQRLASLTSRMHALGRWRLTALEQEQESLGEDLRAVLEAIGRDDGAYGAHAKLGAWRIRVLQRRLDALERETDRAQRAARSQGLRAKLADKAAQTAERARREREARKELADLVERALQRGGASHG